ncbi:EpsG family protein [Planococcus chinensis]|uniref:EpsG family protein n=1 Tax=Planococcus chinensis TaxID=272917 RepID=UPI001CC5461D|nr:EpsG family protein [Planococcus chinensis]
MSLLLTIVSFIALFTNKSNYNKDLITTSKGKNIKLKDEKIISLFIILLIISILTIFAGLRTSFNDTSLYMYLFYYSVSDDLSSLIEIDYSLGAYPGFEIYQMILKILFGENPQILIFASSLIYVGTFIYFYHSYAYKFSLSVYLFLTSGLYIFGMAAIKQTLAMSIGILAIKYLIANKLKTFFLIIFLASTFHPYILLFLLLPLFRKKVWSKKVLFLVFLTAFAVIFYEYLVAALIGVTSEITGKKYQEESFLETEGGSILRILVLSVVPLISWYYRKTINKYRNNLVNISINASILGLLFIIPGYFGGANLFARLSYFFLPFNILSLVWILYNVISNKYRNIMILLCIVFYLVFYLYQYKNFYEVFNHIFQVGEFYNYNY